MQVQRCIDWDTQQWCSEPLLVAEAPVIIPFKLYFLWTTANFWKYILRTFHFFCLVRYENKSRALTSSVTFCKRDKYSIQRTLKTRTRDQDRSHVMGLSLVVTMTVIPKSHFLDWRPLIRLLDCSKATHPPPPRFFRVKFFLYSFLYRITHYSTFVWACTFSLIGLIFIFLNWNTMKRRMIFVFRMCKYLFCVPKKILDLGSFLCLFKRKSKKHYNKPKPTD